MRFLAYILILLYLTTGSSEAKIVYPVETDELLKNPGKGWMTMFTAAVDDRNLPHDIPSSLYYLRISWKSIHIGPDQYDWQPIDGAIERARQGGQQVMIRLMPVWEKAGSPLWMRHLGMRGFDSNISGPKWIADLDDPAVQEHITRILQVMGTKYDRHPGVCALEISFLGIWGEGHFWGAEPPVPLPSPETLKWLADVHYRYFPNTPIIGPVGSSDKKVTTPYMVRQYGDRRGAGIFLDCWGDYKHGWNHMEVGYPKSLAIIHRGGEWDSWKRGIWKLEPCGVMNKWGAGNIRKALKWALDHHASFIGNKNAPIPPNIKQEVKDTLKRIGYRLVLRKVDHPEEATVGSRMDVRLVFENTGVAPPYNDYYLAAKVGNSAGDMQQTQITRISVKHWLPGIRTQFLRIPLKDTLGSDTYRLSIGIVSPYTDQPSIQMPIEGRDPSGWHPVSTFRIVE